MIALAWESRAGAEEPDIVCEDPRVRIQGRPDGRWLEPIVRACEDLRAMPDGDATARVRIVPADADLIVEVVLQDGRSTLRRVRDAAHLRTTLEALLSVPPAPGAAADMQRTVPGPAPRSEPGDVAVGASPPPPPPSAAAPSFGVELGASAGGRVAAGEYFSFAPAGFAQLRAREWLFAMTARWDVVQRKSDVGVSTFEMDTIAAGVGAGRRFRPRFGPIDIGVGPRLVAETQSFEGTSPSEMGEQADTQTDVRLGTFARAAAGAASLRFFVELDAEVSPGRLRRDIRIHPALPPLPSWSAGLGIGVVWGEP